MWTHRDIPYNLNYDKLVFDGSSIIRKRGRCVSGTIFLSFSSVRLVLHQRAKHAIIMATSELMLRIIAQRLTWKYHYKLINVNWSSQTVLQLGVPGSTLGKPWVYQCTPE
jgi:hypothetical protein